MYAEILGDKISLKVRDLFGKSIDRNPNGDIWMENLNQILFPVKGNTPFYAPGFTRFKSNSHPEVELDKENLIILK